MLSEERNLYENRSPAGAKAARGRSKMVSGRPPDGSFVQLGRQGRAEAVFGWLWGRSWGALGGSWGCLEASWASPGASWASPGRSWGAQGCSVALLERPGKIVGGFGRGLGKFREVREGLRGEDL